MLITKNIFIACLSQTRIGCLVTAVIFISLITSFPVCKASFYFFFNICVTASHFLSKTFLGLSRHFLFPWHFLTLLSFFFNSFVTLLQLFCHYFPGRFQISITIVLQKSKLIFVWIIKKIPKNVWSKEIDYPQKLWLRKTQFDLKSFCEKNPRI